MYSAAIDAHECRICRIANGGAAQSIHDHAWLEDNNFVAIASIGAMVPGWSLVLPKRHTLNLTSEYPKVEFHDFVQRAIKRIEYCFGPIVLFEHGCQSAESATGCGTAHAHLHLVPLPFPLEGSVSEFDESLNWKSCSLLDLAENVSGSEYLFVADKYSGAKTTGRLALLHTGRSQFFRRVIAGKIGRPSEYDYRSYPQVDVANATTLALSSVMLSELASVA